MEPSGRTQRVGLSLFTCYNQLRQQIQALLAENEELTRMVARLKEQRHLRYGLISALPAMVPSSAPPAAVQSDRGHFAFPSPDAIPEVDLASAGQSSVLQSPPQESTRVPLAHTATLPSLNTLDFSTGTFCPGIRRPLFWSFPSLDLTHPSLQHSELHQPSTGGPAPAPAEPLQPPPPDQQAMESQAQAARSASRPASSHDPAKSSNPPDARQPALEHLVGEVAFQLDRRILNAVFPNRGCLYGFTVANIPEKIMAMALSTKPPSFDEKQCVGAARRYVAVMARLQMMGYDPAVHPAFAESLVNTYGFLREPLSPGARVQFNATVLHRAITETVPVTAQEDALVLLMCLLEMARLDGQPLFQ